VLEIGTGSGYAAAVLSRIVTQVYTIERHHKLVEYAQARFERLGYTNIQVRHGDGTQGWPEHAPYDGNCGGGRWPGLFLVRYSSSWR
jgi:protein-L-isoaspartate O-methyltransferase